MSWLGTVPGLSTGGMGGSGAFSFDPSSPMSGTTARMGQLGQNMGAFDMLQYGQVLGNQALGQQKLDLTANVLGNMGGGGNMGGVDQQGRPFGAAAMGMYGGGIGGMSGMSAAPPMQMQSIDFTPIQNLLNQAQQTRNTNFADGSTGRVDQNIGQGNVNFLIDKLKQQSQGYNSPQMQAALGQGRENLQNNFLTSLRDLRGVNNTGVPSMTSQGRATDLLKARLQASQDMNQQTQLNSMNYGQNALGTLGTVVGGDISRQMGAQQQNMNQALQEAINRTGNPELGAQLNLQSQQGNQNSQNVINQLQAAMAQAQLQAQVQLQSSSQGGMFGLIQNLLH